MAEKPKDDDRSTMRQAAAQRSTILLRSRLIRRRGVVRVVCVSKGWASDAGRRQREAAGGGRESKMRWKAEKDQKVAGRSDRQRTKTLFRCIPPTFYFLRDAVQKLLQVEVESSRCADAKGRHKKDVLGERSKV